MHLKDAVEVANSVDSDPIGADWYESKLLAQTCMSQYLVFYHMSAFKIFFFNTVKILNIGTCMSEQTV